MASDTPTYPHSSLWPTRKQYLWLLRMEASHRGLLFASKGLELLPSPFTCEEASERYDGDFTPDQWLDVSNCTKEDRMSDIGRNQESDCAKVTDSTERQAILQTYAWLYLKGIQRNLDKKLLEAGATKSPIPCPDDAVLHDLGTLWASTVAKTPTDDKSHVRIGMLSDIPQEGTTIEYINIPFDLSFANFKTQAAALGIVRHLTNRHHPGLAKTLFLSDSLVYHHPYPTAISETDPAFPPEIYPLTRDYDAKDAGWHSHVVPLDSAAAAAGGMFRKLRDWRPINHEADWQSLLHLLKRSAPPRKVFMRHTSVEDRMEFVKRHREREELEMVKTGGFYTNVFLARHMEDLFPSGKLEVPVHPDQNLSGEEWLRRVTDQQRREGEIFEDEVDFFAKL